MAFCDVGMEEDLSMSYEPKYGVYSDYEFTVIRERFVTLYRTYEKLLSAVDDVVQGGMHLNSTVLIQVCGFYVNDLKEVRFFHESPGVGAPRRAAFLARLIARFRPIETEEIDVIDDGSRVPRSAKIKASSKHKADLLSIINSIYALRVFEGMLGLRAPLLRSPMYQEFENDLIFLFQFRDTPKEALVAKARLLLALNKRYS